MGRVTVITSGKGGVGKSTVSVGLAASLSKMGRRVLLIDCDAGLRSLDRMTGIDETLVYDISDVVSGRCTPIDAIYECSSTEGLFLMPAPASINDMVSENVMVKLVAILRKYYDDVILDSPAGLGKGFRAAAAAADRAFLICTADPVCVRSCRTASDILRGIGIDEQRLIINRYDEKKFDNARIITDLDEVIDKTGVRLLGVVPEDYEMIKSMLLQRDYSKTTPGMMALMRIARRSEGENIPVII
jgi:septum site-determining protein MinD